jgi:hypothetical protein
LTGSHAGEMRKRRRESSQSEINMNLLVFVGESSSSNPLNFAFQKNKIDSIPETYGISLTGQVLSLPLTARKDLLCAAGEKHFLENKTQKLTSLWKNRFASHFMLYGKT